MTEQEQDEILTNLIVESLALQNILVFLLGRFAKTLPDPLKELAAISDLLATRVEKAMQTIRVPPTSMLSPAKMQELIDDMFAAAAKVAGQP